MSGFVRKNYVDLIYHTTYPRSNNITRSKPMFHHFEFSKFSSDSGNNGSIYGEFVITFQYEMSNVQNWRREGIFRISSRPPPPINNVTIFCRRFFFAITSYLSRVEWFGGWIISHKSFISYPCFHTGDDVKWDQMVCIRRKTKKNYRNYEFAVNFDQDEGHPCQIRVYHRF